MGEAACAAGADAKAMAASAPQARGRRDGFMLEISMGFVLDRALVALDRPGFQHVDVTNHTGKRRPRQSLSSSGNVRRLPMESRCRRRRKRRCGGIPGTV